MMSTYLGGDADALDGCEFLTMAEAGEVGYWEVVHKLSERGGATQIRALAEWAKPIQRRYLDQALEGSLRLAGSEDPNAVE